MNYHNGGKPRVGDRVSFAHWNGRHLGTVAKVGRVFIRVVYPSKAPWADCGVAFVTILARLATLERSVCQPIPDDAALSKLDHVLDALDRVGREAQRRRSWRWN